MRSLAVLSILLVALLRSAAAAPPDPPYQPHPTDGATRVYINSVVQWWGTDPDGDVLTYDLYWGADPTPPLVAVNIKSGYNNHAYYNNGLLAYSTTYYWRVVARDPANNETSGPMWSHTTKAENEPPYPANLESPANGGTGIPINATLDFWGNDMEGDDVNYDVYLGTDANPPLVADHLILSNYKTELLAPAALYYWHVVTRDSHGLETIGPTWTFTTANTSNLIPETPFNPYPASANQDGPNPILRWFSSDPEGEPLTFHVYLSTVYPTEENPIPLVGTTTANEFPVGPLIEPARYYWTVRAIDSYWTVKGPLWTFANGQVPVLFSRFDARHSGDDVDVRWELSSDEPMESYTLFRREASGASLAIANAPVNGVEGSYVDSAVEARKTYHYELLIRTADGDEFRSPIATVSMPALELTLHQNIPNPFNPRTSIRYELPEAARVRLMIFDVSGRLVRTLLDENRRAGSHAVTWAGRDDGGRTVSSGVYFYVLEAGKQRLTRKLVLLK